MKRFFVVVLFFGIAFEVLALSRDHKIDSLVTALKEELQPENRIKILSKLTSLHYRSDFEKSLAYANKLTTLVNEHGTYQDKGNAAFSLGKVYRYNGQFDLAFENYLHAVELFRKASSDVRIADVFDAIGFVFYKVQEYDQAKQYYYDALFLYEKHHLNMDIIRTSFNLGTCFRKQKKYDEALHYTYEALRLGKKMKDQISINDTYNYIGAIYYEREDYHLARKNYFNSIETIDKMEGKSLRLSYAYNNIGETYRDEGDLSNAYEYFQKALVEKRKLEKPELTSSTLLNIGKLHLMTKEYLKAIAVLNDAVSMINPKMINETLTEAIEELSIAYKMADEAGLDVNLRPLIVCNELLADQFKLTNEMAKKLTEKHNQYMLDKSFEKQALQANIGQLQNTKLYLIWAGVLIITVFLFLIFLMNRALKKAQHKSQEIVQTLNQMKGVLGDSFQRMSDDDTFTIITKK